MRRCAALLLAASAGAAPGPARAQTMLDQEERLIDIHCLLLDLPPVQAPAALASWAMDASVEAVIIPGIDGTTGSKRQITASDRTPVFPRPRLMLGLPAPEGWRAFAGVSYIPPITINEVSTNAVAAEAGLAMARGPFRIGARLHGIYASSRSPVTDPSTRDTLETYGGGADLAVGAPLEVGDLALEPYAGAGAVALHGRFEVTSDGNVLRSTWAGVALHAGVRAVFRGRWEAVAELDAYLGRLVHVDARVGYLFSL